MIKEPQLCQSTCLTSLPLAVLQVSTKIETLMYKFLICRFVKLATSPENASHHYMSKDPSSPESAVPSYKIRGFL